MGRPAGPLKTEIKGACFGMRIERRGEDDRHAIVRVLVEDDEFWHDTDTDFDSAWIDDLILVLQETRRTLKRQYKRSDDGLGFEFKG